MQVKKRSLADLFQVGRELTLSDGVNEITVYLQKLTPVQAETALRKANAVRASHLAQRNNPDSEGYLSALNEVLNFTEEEMVSYLANEEFSRNAPALEAEWAEENGWNDEDYLQSLWDLWNEPGVQERYFVPEGEESDPEAKRVFDEMQRYRDESNAYLQGFLDHTIEEFALLDHDTLVEKMLDRLIRTQADLAWMLEYRKCEVWLGTRVASKDHAPYFDHRSEVDSLANETMGLLIEGMASLEVEVDQGKDSEEIQDSSNSSELLEAQEELDSSSLPV